MKISLILPYWDRQEAADKALRLLDKTYAGKDLEVVIVDDGNEIPFVAPDTSLNINIVRLPEKHEPKCPSTAWNAGVTAASADIIALSCIEILHENPVLFEMAEQADELGKKGYVLAAAWCPEMQSWHCHSSVKVPTIPEGAGIAFCGVMHKSLYESVGGFDEAYRDGAGYEDRDFINRLIKGGAKFVIRDDLVVIHPKSGATIHWGAEKFARNEKLYFKKWQEELQLCCTNFVCVNIGNYCGRGSEYVNNLFDMVKRNLPLGIFCRFFCITDDSSGLDSYINTIAPEPDIKGWYGKLYMFKPGLFRENDRMVYFDLDTLIVSRLESIINYDGEFAILRDFNHSNLVGPGVMLWRAGAATSIWEEWNNQGRPTHEFGDLWFINQLDCGEFAKSADKLQDLFPHQFVSYKLHSQRGAPKDSVVVCFHGLPRPHEVNGWVSHVWKKDGMVRSDLKIVNNVNDDVIRRNIHHNSLRDMPWLELQTGRREQLLIVGGGPSLMDSLPVIKAKQKDGAKILALNGVGNFLEQNGILPDYIIVVDARECNLRFVESKIAKEYWLASQCDASLFDCVSGMATLFHIDIPKLGYYVPGDRPIQAVGGGITVGLIAMSVAYAQGFRALELFGYDSSCRDDAHHAYEQKENDEDPLLRAHFNGKEYLAAPWMITQATQFQDLSPELSQLGCEICVHGSGLLPAIAWQMMLDSRQAV